MRYILYLSLVIILAACGGGGDDTPAPDQSNGQTAPQDSAPPIAEFVLPTLPPIIIATDENGVEFALPPEEEPSFEEQIAAQLAPGQSNVIIPTQTPASEGALAVPLPGTLVASETEEVEPIPDFEQITLTQQGGRNNTVIRIDIYADGRVVRGDQSGFVDAATIAQLNQAIRDLNFFGLQGTYLGPPSNNDGYTYRITVNSGPIERAINTQDGFMPVELTRFLGLVRSIGDSIAS